MFPGKGLLITVLFTTAIRMQGQFDLFQPDLNLTIQSNIFGTGVSLFDFDADGLDDITVMDTQYGIRAYRNIGDSTFLLAHEFLNSGKVKCATWVDYDNDADADFFFTCDNCKNQLFRNDGNGIFTDRSNFLNGFQLQGQSMGCSWADYDRDGWLDLYVCNYDVIVGCATNWLHHNNGDGTFTEMASVLGIDNGNNYTFQSMWTDINLDGWLDLYIANDHFGVNQLYLNTEGVFEDAGIETGLDIALDGMGNSISDFDNDGDFDIYITNTYYGNYLMRNDAGVFTNVMDEVGTGVYEWSWSGLWLDFDLDGDDDLHVSTRGLPAFPEQNPFLVNANGVFELLNNNGISEDEFESYSAAKGDLNNDGKWDFVVTNQHPVGTAVWMNSTEGTGHWIKLGLQGTVSNRDAIGSRIQCYHGGQMKLLETYCGENYLSQDSQYEIIGLGEDSVIDSLIITWPRGWIDKYYNVAADQWVELVEGETYSAAITSNAEGLCPLGGEMLLDAGTHDFYSWSDGSQEQYLVVTEPGLYEVVVTDLWGFQASAAIEIFAMPEFLATSSFSDPTCFNSTDGSIELSFDSSLSQSIEWNTGSSLTYLDDLPAGTYSCTIIDVYGCSYLYEYILTNPSPIEAQIESEPILCFGESTTVNAVASGGTGELILEWGNSDPMEVYAGVHELTVTDENNCSSDFILQLGQPDSIWVENLTPGVCFGETTSPLLEVNGGVPSYTLYWNVEDEINLYAGTYDVMVIDANGCSDSTQIVISEYEPILFNSDITSAIDGDGGSISLFVTGGIAPYEYQWTNGSTDNPVSDLPPGTFECVIEDAAGCLVVANGLVVDDILHVSASTFLVLAYPNPFDEYLHVPGIDHVSITDMLGREIWNSAFSVSRVLDTSSWTSGFYMQQSSSGRVLLIKQ